MDFSPVQVAGVESFFKRGVNLHQIAHGHLDRTIALRLRYPASMHFSPWIETGDRALIQIVDAAVAEAARKSGPWLVCRLGCTQCCIGAFPISQLDAERLRRGLAELETQNPERARRVRERARQSVARISRDFPGD